MKYLLFIVLLMLNLSGIFAQQAGYRFEYEGVGDNREYFSGYNTPETILGSKISVGVFTQIDSIHSLTLGVGYFHEAATALSVDPIFPLIHYRFNNEKLSFTFGSFDRNISDSYPVAFFSEKYYYYNPTIEGLAAKFKMGKGQTSFFVDWVSKIDSFNREQFMAGLSFNLKQNNFSLDFFAYLFHDRPNLSRPPGEFINDYIGFLGLLGYDFSPYVFFDRLSLKVGALSSLHRDRANGSDFNVAYSVYSEAEIAWKFLGLKAIMNVGDPHSLSHGDEFFNHATSYFRADLYADLISHRNVNARLSWNFHVINGILEHQQLLKLSYFFQRKR